MHIDIKTKMCFNITISKDSKISVQYPSLNAIYFKYTCNSFTLAQSNILIYL